MVHSQPYRSEEWLREKYVDEMMSDYDIADECGVSQGTIQNWRTKFGIDARNHPLSVSLGKNGNRPHFRTTQMGYEEAIDNRDGEKLHVQIHRLTAVAHWGFQAVCGMVVHHENGIPWDNRADNMQLMSKQDHSALHIEPKKMAAESLKRRQEKPR